MVDRPSESPSNNLWIISSGRFVNFTVDGPGQEKDSATAREYRISALGRYLIAPQPITVKRRLIGCEVHWKTSDGPRLLPKSMISFFKMGTARRPPMTLIIDDRDFYSRLSNENLQAHIKAIEDKLRPYDTFHRALARIDTSRVAGITGICQDRVGARSHLTISGDSVEQLDYVTKHVANEVPVQLKCAQIADGLFELQGFDVTQWDPESTFSLVRMYHNEKAAVCVLNDDHTIAFWLDDPKVIGYLQLFEYCLQTNDRMRESLGRCFSGNAELMRLMFNQALEIDYGQAQLPAIFREIIEGVDKTGQVTRTIKQSLNYHQLGVSLNSLLHRGADDGALCTDISVLQDMRALEPVRKRFPEVFKAVTQRASHSDAGRFYQLESIHGIDYDN